jgi:thiocyanate hydrolase gamma subunit
MAEKHKAAPMVDEVSDFEVLEVAVRELAIEKGLFSAEDHRRFAEFAHSIGPLPAARLVAKSWLDPEFKQLALEDGFTASKEVGIDWLNPTGFGTPSDYCDLRVLENTPSVHHVVVCTLCSCYPWPVLGLPPTWFKSAPYRSRVVIDPRNVLREFGLELDESVAVRVWDSSAEIRYMVLPERPSGTENMTEEELAQLVERDSMIGVTKVRLDPS